MRTDPRALFIALIIVGIILLLFALGVEEPRQ
jgi:hypothetical protein